MLTDCVACGGKLQDSRVAGLGHCPTCKHYTIYEPIGTGKYDADYIARYDGYENTPIGRKLNMARWKLVGQYMTSGDVLDWGCGNGAFLRHAPDGYQVEGYDINPFSRHYKPGKDWMGDRYDAVTLWDVIEHMENPHEFIASLPTSYVFIVTPDISGVSEAEIPAWKHYRPDEHQHYFTPLSLFVMLGSCGYEVRHIDRVEGMIRDKKNPGALLTMVGVRRAA